MQFEDLEAWREARRLVCSVYSLTKDKELSGDFRLCSQIQAAAVSIMSNIAEGFERRGKAEKAQFYSIARASCGELRSQLYVIEDVFPRFASKTVKLREDSVIVGKLISGLISSNNRRP